LKIEYLTGNTYYKYLQLPEGGALIDVELAAGGEAARKKNDIEYFVFEIDFMVKLLRACVWMPWRKEAMKDVVSCDKPREDANSL
jgi:hypothetical protein